MSNISHKNNNNLEKDKIIKGIEGIDKDDNLSVKNNKETKYISEKDENKTLIHEESSMTKEEQIENDNLQKR